MSLKLGNTTIAGISRETKLNVHSLLDFKWTDHILNEMSWLRADTFSWQSGDVYTFVYNLLVAEYQNGTEETEGSITFKRSPNGYKITTDESGVSALFNNTGVAWYYILDTANRRFKLPRTKYGFTGLRDSVGNYIPESLPNIRGSVASATWWESGDAEAESGALYRDHINHGYRESNGGTAGDLTLFDASRSSSTYQDNAPVQQRATQMYLYFYVGEFSQTATEQTAGLNSAMFNNKVDKDDLTEVMLLIESFVSGASGYNIWSNGYCEQWGNFGPAFSSWSNKTITFMKEFKNTDYNVWAMTGNTSNTDSPCINVKTTTSFSCTPYNSTGNACWKACGYLADGEY